MKEKIQVQCTEAHGACKVGEIFEAEIIYSKRPWTPSQAGRVEISDLPSMTSHPILFVDAAGNPSDWKKFTLIK